MATTPNARQIEDAIVSEASDPTAGQLPVASGTGKEITWTDPGTAVLNNVSSITFDTAAGVSVSEGEIAWNATDGTVDIGLPDGVVLQTGQEFLARILNTTGTTLVDGEAVYITGAQGNRTTVARAQANSVNADLTLGIVTQTILNNQEGFITLLGLVRNFDTSSWLQGDELWLSASVSGGITNVKPAAPNHSVHIGFVVRSHASVGSIFVRVLAEEGLDELHDVVITSLSDRELLIFDSASQTWINGDLDYGDFAGAQPIILQNNIRLFGRNAADTSSIDIGRVSDSDIVILGDTDNITTIQSSIVPRAFYGGVQYDIITTEGGQTIGGATFGLNNVAYSWPAADGSNGQALTTNGAGTLSWTFKVSSVSGGSNITITGGVQSPIVNLDSSQTHTTFSLNTTDAAGGANEITAGTNSVLTWDWDGANTSVSLDHNDSPVLTVDENGITGASGENVALGLNSTICRFGQNAATLAQVGFNAGTAEIGVDATNTVVGGGAGINTTSIGNATTANTSNINIGTGAGVHTVQILADAADFLGHFGATPVAQQTVTGSTGGNVALQNLLTALANYGLIVDSTT